MSRKEENSKKSGDELSLNPQKTRLEQLRKRKEHAEMLEKQQIAHNSKSKKKASKEPIASKENLQETGVKMSAEVVDLEYSVEEDYEDEEYKSTKNEMIKKLLIDKNRLEKSIKLATENEKKLKSMYDASGKWFDRYDKMLNELDEQLTAYDINRKVVVDNIIGNVQPLCERWQQSQKTMTAVKISVIGTIPSISVFGNLAHYGISILRQVLFYMAYCRDLISKSPLNTAMTSTPPNSDSPRTLNSLTMISSDRK